MAASRPTWFEADPAALERVEAEVVAKHPGLRREVRGRTVVFVGRLPVVAQGVELDEFEVEVHLPDDFPGSMPAVYEMGGRIRRTVDDHTYGDGRLCLFAPGERWSYWPRGAGLVAFLDDVVVPHLAQRLFSEEFGWWPFGERSHGATGLFESWSELFGTTDRVVIVQLLDLLTHPDPPKGHWTCPCGSGQRLRQCHGQQIRSVRGRISPAEAIEMQRALAVNSSRPAPGLTPAGRKA